MKLSLTGRARRLGADINTDYIISSARKRETIDPHELKRWLLEGIDPTLAASVQEGDILVAGPRFGSGSAMEVAVTVVQAAGVRVVVADSFSRAYFRNAINNGLWPIECDTSGIEEGDTLRVEMHREEIQVVNEARATSRHGHPLSAFVRGIVEAGGLVKYLSQGGAFEADVSRPIIL